MKDYATILGLDEEDYDIDSRSSWTGLFNYFTASGERHNNGFWGADEKAVIWTSEQSEDPDYHMVVEIFDDDVFFSGINCENCFYSIRLIQE